MPSVGVTKRVRSGPPVPVVIWRPCPLTPADYWIADPEDWLKPLDRHPPLTAMIGDKQVDPNAAWETMRFIGFRDWLYLWEVRAWAKAHAPDHHMAQDRKPVTLNDLPVSFVV